MILLIDNYDSFVFNLQRYLGRLRHPTQVVRNDQVPLERIAAGDYQAIVISPGPKAPEHAGQTLEVIERFHTDVPMLGVCLGHQAICQALGGRVIRAPRAVHGQSSPIEHRNSRLFAGLPNPFHAARYHSLIVDRATLPAALTVTGVTSVEQPLAAGAADRSSTSEIVMAVEHSQLPLFGVQFHPESILSDVGYRILANFLQIAGLGVAQALPTTDFATSDVWNSFQTANSKSSAALALDEDQWPPAVLPQSLPLPPEQPAP